VIPGFRCIDLGKHVMVSFQSVRWLAGETFVISLLVRVEAFRVREGLCFRVCFVFISMFLAM